MVVNSDEICQPGLELKLKVMAVNEAEDGEILPSQWSEEGTYTCRYEGIGQIDLPKLTIEVVVRVEMVPPFGFPYFPPHPPHHVAGRPTPLYPSTRYAHPDWRPHVPRLPYYYPWYFPRSSMYLPPGPMAAYRRPVANSHANNSGVALKKAHPSRMHHPWW